MANPAAGPLLTFAAVAVFATLSSVTLLGSLPDLAVQLACLGLVLAMLAVTDGAAVVGRFAAAAVLGLGVQSLLGLYQYVARIPIEKAWVDLTLEPNLSVRVVGSFGNPNVFAEYLVLLLPVAIGLLVSARSRLTRLAWLCACGLGAVALVLTFSRGGWLGLAAGVVGFAIIRDRRLLALLLVGALIVAAMPIGQNLIVRRLQSIIRPVDSSSAYRIVVWRETLSMIQDYWPSGVGLGHRAYMAMYPRYMLDRTKRPYHSHSAYLQVLAETGVPGLFALLWVMWRVARTGFASLRRLGARDRADGKASGGRRRARPDGDPILTALIAGGLAALAGAAVHGVVEPLLYIPRISATLWMVVGLVLCAGKVALAESSETA
jgi:O-antigen ligase